MTDDRWIIVHHWDRFQHYRDRAPLWIKLYLELEDKPEWTNLDLADQGLLIRIWMLYARTSGRLQVALIHRSRPPHSTIRALSYRLDRLEKQGFIRVCDAPVLAQRREDKKKKEERASKTRAEPRAAAAAYQPFQPAPAEPYVDPEVALELARRLAK